MRTIPSIRSSSVEVQAAYERVLADTSVGSNFVEAGGGSRIHLLEKGDGPPLVLLHGTTASAGFFVQLGPRCRDAQRTHDIRALPGKGVHRHPSSSMPPDVAAVITATGFRYSSPVPTSQSSAFFSAPATPPAYSGGDQHRVGEADTMPPVDDTCTRRLHQVDVERRELPESSVVIDKTACRTGSRVRNIERGAVRRTVPQAAAHGQQPRRVSGIRTHGRRHHGRRPPSSRSLRTSEAWPETASVVGGGLRPGVHVDRSGPVMPATALGSSRVP